MDRLSIIKSVNKTAERILGINEFEIHNKLLDTIYNVDDTKKDELRKIITEITNIEKTHNVEAPYPYENKKQKTIWIKERFTSFSDPITGNIESIVLILKEMEEPTNIPVKGINRCTELFGYLSRFVP